MCVSTSHNLPKDQFIVGPSFRMSAHHYNNIWLKSHAPIASVYITLPPSTAVTECRPPWLKLYCPLHHPSLVVFSVGSLVLYRPLNLWSRDDTRSMTLWRIQLGRTDMRDDTTFAMI